MKRTNTILASALLFLFTIPGFASHKLMTLISPSELRVVQKKDPSKYELIYVAQEESSVQIFIVNERGKVVKKDLVENRKSFIKTYDLSNLDPGRYIFKVKDGSQELSEEIYYDPARTLLKLALLNKEEHKLNVIVTGFDQSQPVVIRIYNPKGQLVKNDKVVAGRDFVKTYDLSKIDSEFYTVTATNGSASVLKESGIMRSVHQKEEGTSHKQDQKKN